MSQMIGKPDLLIMAANLEFEVLKAEWVAAHFAELTSDEFEALFEERDEPEEGGWDLEEVADGIDGLDTAEMNTPLERAVYYLFVEIVRLGKDEPLTPAMVRKAAENIKFLG